MRYLITLSSAIPPALTTSTPEIDLGNNNQEYGSNWLIITAALNLVQMVLELLIHFVMGTSISIFFPLFTCDIILISTDHFPLLLFSIISLPRIYTRVLFYLSGQYVVCVCCHISRIKLNGAQPLTNFNQQKTETNLSEKNLYNHDRLYLSTNLFESHFKLSWIDKFQYKIFFSSHLEKLIELNTTDF